VLVGQHGRIPCRSARRPKRRHKPHLRGPSPAGAQTQSGATPPHPRRRVHPLAGDAAALPTDPTKRGEAVRELTRDSELVAAALADDWQLGGAGNCLSTWTRVWHGDTRGVWVALIPAMSSDPLELPVLGDGPSPATLARRLALFAAALRAPWAMSPGTTGLDLMISLRAKDRERLFTPREPVPPAKVSTLEQDLNWSRVSHR
jgi:hypothetical protein